MLLTTRGLSSGEELSSRNQRPNLSYPDASFGTWEDEENPEATRLFSTGLICVRSSHPLTAPGELSAPVTPSTVCSWRSSVAKEDQQQNVFLFWTLFTWARSVLRGVSLLDALRCLVDHSRGWGRGRNTQICVTGSWRWSYGIKKGKALVQP